MDLKTFKIGGVHPPENKLSAGLPIEAAELPKRAFIHLGQHLGAPAKPVVQKGDKVKVGTLIGTGEGFISASVHSSVSGTVSGIDDVVDASGYKRKAVIIDVAGDEWEPAIDRSPELKKEITLDQKAIVEKIKESGIVGLGGATFPAHVKYMVPEGKKVDTLLINAVECEPYLTSDHRVMLERADEVLVGTQILMKALGVGKAIIGIEANKPDALELLSRKAKEYTGVAVQGLKVQYPQGAEKQLIKACLNREVPSGKLPLDVGCVVNNVGTALAVYEAVQKNKPLFERVVTMTGRKLPKKANFLVRVGTPISQLIAACGGIPEGTAKFINGGPMMGKAMTNPETPVTKGTSGVILVDESEAKRNAPGDCIRCAKCVSACPMGLEPYLIEKQAEYALWEEAEKEDAADCMECGCCQFTCPAARPLLDNIRLAKANVMRIRRERSKK